MKIPVFKFIILCVLRLLRILLEKAVCLLSSQMGSVIGLIDIYDPRERKKKSYRRRKQPRKGRSQTLPPFRVD